MSHPPLYCNITRYHLQYGNILQVELDMPNRTTRDYEVSGGSLGWQAVLDDAFKDEEEITIQAS